MAIVRNTVKPARTSQDGVSHGEEPTSRARNPETATRLAGVGYPTRRNGLADSAKWANRLGGVG